MFGVKKKLAKLEEVIQEICPHEFNSGSYFVEFDRYFGHKKKCIICGRKFSYTNPTKFDKEFNDCKIKETEELLKKLKGEK